MSKLIRSYDWSTTSLGAPDHWPQSLRITLSILLKSKFPMFLWWGDDLIQFYNDAYRPSLGNPGKHPAALGQKGAECWPEIWPVIEPMINQVLGGGEATWNENQLIPIFRNGKLEDVYWTYGYSPVPDESGRPRGVLVTCTETTGEVQARLANQASEQRLKNLFSEAPVAIAIFRGPEHVIELANEAHLNLWGRRADEVLGKPLFEALPETKGQGYEGLLANVLYTGESFHAHELHAPLVRNGQLETVYFNFIYQALRELDGRITGVIVIANEITEQVLARKAVEASQAKLSALVEEAPIATCLFVGKDMVIELANEVTLGYWGKDRSVLGKPLREAIPELVGQPFLDQLADVFSTGNTYEARSAPAALEVNGVLVTYYFDYTYKPLRDAAGDVYAILDMAVDVTEQVLGRQQLEASENRYRVLSTQLELQVQARTEELEAANEELASANEELAATNEELTVSNEETLAANADLSDSNHLLARSNDNLEKFAYIASHDLQEPLRKIQSFGDLLKHQYGSQLGDGIHHLERMQSAANRMSTLIRDLLAFSRITTQQELIAPVPLTDVLTSVLTDLELRIEETGAVIQVDHLPTVQGDKSQLEQLFQNLLNNALKFRREEVSPVIQLSTQLVDHTELPASVKPARWTKVYYRIDVADNGIGFNEKYLDRIFQVFQRLNGRVNYAGTGIGLAICEKVVVNHGGAITATSQPGQGATFSVYLPRLPV